MCNVDSLLAGMRAAGKKKQMQTHCRQVAMETNFKYLEAFTDAAAVQI